MKYTIESKTKSVGQLSQLLLKARESGKRIVFTNGCFDILHVGHVLYLSSAKRLGDILVVGLNSDKSVRKIKGPTRPVNKQKDRAIVLSALKCVDYVVVFNESNPKILIRRLRPDILVKGSDWKLKDIIGADFVSSYGGKVARIRYVRGYSTTSTLKRIGCAR